jgi:serine/threonine-protein kinase HipA
MYALANALIFNWLIAGTDAHAKNYSLLIGTQQRVRLAPLYDIASVLAYADIDLRRVQLAMRVGRYDRFDVIQARHWKEAARALKIDPERLLHRIAEMTTVLPDAVADAARALEKQRLRHPNLTRLRDALHERAAECARSSAA